MPSSSSSSANPPAAAASSSTSGAAAAAQEPNLEGIVRARIDVQYGPLPAHRLDLHIPTALDAADADSDTQVGSGTNASTGTGIGSEAQHPQPGGAQLRQSLRPLLVFVHGGAWRSYVLCRLFDYRLNAF